MKGIPMKTWEVRAILDNRKTVTRRVVKPHYRAGEAGFRVVTNKHTGKYVRIEIFDEWEDETRWLNDPYRPGDILYVRETWCPQISDEYPFVYKASVETPAAWKWRPSIHMPREAARIFLRVTDVRVERLQDITEEQAVKEGFEAYHSDSGYYEPATLGFVETWHSTLKPADRALYGWDANPWVWVIEFERCEKPEEGTT